MSPACGWAASLSLACCAGAADAEPQRPFAPAVAPTVSTTAPAVPRAALVHLRPQDRVGELLDHPALSGISRLPLPRSNVEVDRKTRSWSTKTTTSRQRPRWNAAASEDARYPAAAAAPAGR